MCLFRSFCSIFSFQKRRLKIVIEIKLLEIFLYYSLPSKEHIFFLVVCTRPRSLSFIHSFFLSFYFYFPLATFSLPLYPQCIYFCISSISWANKENVRSVQMFLVTSARICLISSPFNKWLLFFQHRRCFSGETLRNVLQFDQFTLSLTKIKSDDRVIFSSPVYCHQTL